MERSWETYRTGPIADLRNGDKRNNTRGNYVMRSKQRHGVIPLICMRHLLANLATTFGNAGIRNLRKEINHVNSLMVKLTMYRLLRHLPNIFAVLVLAQILIRTIVFDFCISISVIITLVTHI